MPELPSNPVPAFGGLLLREWLEHRATVILPPAILLGLIILAILMGVVFSERIAVDIEFDEHTSSPAPTQRLRPLVRSQFLMVNADRGDAGDFRVMPVAAPAPLDFEIDSRDVVDADGFDRLQYYLSIPFFGVLLLVVTLLAVSVTWDERKDRSILFWKSMPVGDTQAIVAKFVFLGWVTPWASVIAILIAHAIVAVVLDVYSDEALLVHLATSADFYAGIVQILCGALLFGFWLAPVLAWLMFAGATTPRSPFMAGVFGPVVLMVLEKVLFDTTTVFRFFTTHLGLVTLPDPDQSLPALFGVFADPRMWTGLAVAALLLAATIHSRRRFNEV